MASILIAEDDAHILRILSLWLTRNGHQVLEARDGRAAMELLSNHSVDIVVSDVNMPNVSGIELVRWLRETQVSALPVIMLSSRSDQSLISEELKPFGVTLHPKPFSPSRMVAEIERLAGVTPGVRGGG